MDGDIGEVGKLEGIRHISAAKRCWLLVWSRSAAKAARPVLMLHSALGALLCGLLGGARWCMQAQVRLKQGNYDLPFGRLVGL